MPVMGIVLLWTVQADLEQNNRNLICQVVIQCRNLTGDLLLRKKITDDEVGEYYITLNFGLLVNDLDLFNNIILSDELLLTTLLTASVKFFKAELLIDLV